MEDDQGAGAPSDEPQADSAALSDTFSQLWTDVMGMLVSFGGGVPRSYFVALHSSTLSSKLTLTWRKSGRAAKSHYVNHTSQQSSQGDFKSRNSQKTNTGGLNVQICLYVSWSRMQVTRIYFVWISMRKEIQWDGTLRTND